MGYILARLVDQDFFEAGVRQVGDGVDVLAKLAVVGVLVGAEGAPSSVFAADLLADDGEVGAGGCLPAHVAGLGAVVLDGVCRAHARQPSANWRPSAASGARRGARLFGDGNYTTWENVVR